MAISSETIVVVSDSQTSSELHGETVILEFDKGAYFGLDEIGTLIWRELQQPRTVRRICDVVSEQYDVDEATCEQDVISLLETLHTAGLIVVRGMPTI